MERTGTQNKKKKTASGGKQSLKQSMDGQLESDHLDCRQLLDKLESRQQLVLDAFAFSSVGCV